jgi:hypothetical protein
MRLKHYSIRGYRDAMDVFFQLRFAESDALGLALLAEGADAQYVVANSPQLHLRWLETRLGERRSRLLNHAMRFVELILSPKYGCLIGRVRKGLGEILGRKKTESFRRSEGIGVGRFFWSRMVYWQLKEIKPDVILVQDHFLFAASDLNRLRRIRARLVLQCAVTMPAQEFLQEFDGLVTTNWNNLRLAREMQMPALLTRHAFDDRNLEFVGGDRDLDLVIAGTNSPLHEAGSALIGYLSEIGVNFTYFSESPISEEVAVEQYGGPLWGIDYHRVLARSKVIVNRHADHASNANNLRLFEATGMGAVLLTEDLPGISELFEIGEEVLTYSSRDDLVQKIQFLLANPSKREGIAAGGQKRTLLEHTYRSRAQDLIEFFATF